MRLKINEAIEHAAQKGVQVKKKDLGTVLFPKSEKHVAAINMSNLCAGRTKRVTGEQVVKIAEVCKVPIAFLFGKEK